MFATTFNDYHDAEVFEKTDSTTNRAETREQEHSRLVREWTETLSNMPGFRGRQLRRALETGWC